MDEPLEIKPGEYKRGRIDFSSTRVPTSKLCRWLGVPRKYLEGVVEQETLTVLKIAALPQNSLERRVAYGAACGKYTEEVVLGEFASLLQGGYILTGVLPRNGWLTDAGKAVLEVLTRLGERK